MLRILDRKPDLAVTKTVLVRLCLFFRIQNSFDFVPKKDNFCEKIRRFQFGRCTISHSRAQGVKVVKVSKRVLSRRCKKESGYKFVHVKKDAINDAEPRESKVL